MMLYVKHNDDNVTDVIMLLFGFIVMFVLLQVFSQWQNISTKLDVWIFFYYLFFVSLTKISFEIVKEKEAISFRLINYMLLLSRMGAVKISAISQWMYFSMNERNQRTEWTNGINISFPFERTFLSQSVVSAAAPYGLLMVKLLKDINQMSCYSYWFHLLQQQQQQLTLIHSYINFLLFFFWIIFFIDIFLSLVMMMMKEVLNCM